MNNELEGADPRLQAAVDRRTAANQAKRDADLNAREVAYAYAVEQLAANGLAPGDVFSWTQKEGYPSRLVTKARVPMAPYFVTDSTWGTDLGRVYVDYIPYTAKLIPHQGRNMDGMELGMMISRATESGVLQRRESYGKD